MVVLPGLLWLGGLAVSSVSAQTDADLFILTQSQIKPFAKSSTEQNPAMLLRHTRNLGTIPDQQWKGIPDTKIYTFDENKKVEKSHGTFFRANGKIRGSQVNTNTKPKPWPHQAEPSEPQGCGNPVCVIIDMKPRRFKSLCDLKRYLKEKGRLSQVNFVQKGDCYDIIDNNNGATDKPWITPGEIKDCSACVASDICGKDSVVLNIDISNLVRGYSSAFGGPVFQENENGLKRMAGLPFEFTNICDAMKFLEQNDNTNKKTQVIGVSFACVADIYPTQGDTCLFTEWFDMDTPCNSDKDVESHMEHKLTLDTTLTGPQRICAMEDVRQTQHVGGSEVTYVTAEDAIKGNAVGSKPNLKFAQKLQESVSEIACLSREQDPSLKLPPPFIYKDDKNNSCLDYKARYCCRSQAMFRAMPLSALLVNRVPDSLPVGLSISAITIDSTGRVTTVKITIYCGSQRAMPNSIELKATDNPDEYAGQIVEQGTAFKISALLEQNKRPDDSQILTFSVGFIFKNNLTPIGSIEINVNPKITDKFAVSTTIKTGHITSSTLLQTGTGEGPNPNNPDASRQNGNNTGNAQIPPGTVGNFNPQAGEFPFVAQIVSQGDRGGSQTLVVNLKNDQAFLVFNQGVLFPASNTTDLYKNLETIASTYAINVAVDSPPLATLFSECDWKDWVNVDYPNKIEGTNGEYELRFRHLEDTKLVKNVCGKVPNAAQYVDAVTVETLTPWAELKMGNVVYETFKLTPFFGYACKDENGEKDFCSDMKVRYCCAKESRATWGEWGSWSNCSVLCGGGQCERKRGCNRKVNQGANHNNKCFGEEDSNSEITKKRFTTQTQPCNVESCPVDFKWGSWSSWSKCTISCGAGTKTRKRICEPAINGGKDCPIKKDFLDLYENIESCAEKDCERFEEGAWSSWSACSATCGTGQVTRKRHCRSMETLAAVPEAFCQSDPSVPLPTTHFLQADKCHLGECAVNGGWTEWELWSTCSQSCVPHPDAGDRNATKAFRSRKRFCANPIPAFGGNECVKDPKFEYLSNEKAEMDKTDCITEDSKSEEGSVVTPWCPEPCIYSEWGDWGPCDRTCMDLNTGFIEAKGMNGIDLRGVQLIERATQPAYPKRVRMRCLVKEARFGGKCTEKEVNHMTPSSKNGTAIWQTEDCRLCKEHCQGWQNTANTTMIAQMAPLAYPTADPACVGWCPLDCKWKPPVLLEENDCSCALTRLSKEKASDYTKISEAQKKTINNCFLARSAVIASKGNSGSEKGVLDEITDTLMKMADELHGKNKTEGEPIIKKYRANVPPKIMELSSDPSTASAGEEMAASWSSDVSDFSRLLINKMTHEVQEPVYDGLFGGISCRLPERFKSRIVSTLPEKWDKQRDKFAFSYKYNDEFYACKHPVCQLTPAEGPNVQPGVAVVCVRAAWGQWGEWAQCDEKCGDKGTRLRKRECLSICEPEKKMELTACTPYLDPTSKQTWTNEYKGPCIPCPPEYAGSWSEWTSWATEGAYTCSKEPGKTFRMSRKKECIQTSTTTIPCQMFKNATDGVITDEALIPIPPCP